MASTYAKARDFLEFVGNSPSAFHAVTNAKERLISAGFTELRERDVWKTSSDSVGQDDVRGAEPVDTSKIPAAANTIPSVGATATKSSSDSLSPGGKYFFTRNQSSILAFQLPTAFKSADALSFAMVAAHTDSPCFKLKPNFAQTNLGYLQVGVQIYGGGLWHTWFDRDLGVGGRVVSRGSDGSIKSHLVRIDRPILRIPNLAIHLTTNRTEGFKPNIETNMVPILGLVEQKVNEKADTSDSAVAAAPALLEAVAKEAGVTVSDIIDYELCLYDIQKPALGGMNEEFVLSARLDNLMMSYCSLQALIQASGVSAPSNSVRIVSLFDNEEVGSQSAYGAGSQMLENTLKRIVSTVGNSQSSALESAIHRSYLISADMAHAVHPNYQEKHEREHRPRMNAGVVIKINANQRYTTTSVTGAILRDIAKRGLVKAARAKSDNPSIPVQSFVVRNDSPCGSTIGPMLSTMGLRTVDVGNPQLAMHSIREMAGSADVDHAIDLFEAFYEHYEDVESTMQVD